MLFCSVDCSEVHEHMQPFDELWRYHNTIITKSLNIYFKHSYSIEYLRKKLKYPQRISLFDLNNIMSMVDPRAIIVETPRTNWWDLRSITFQNFDKNIKCRGIHWIGYSKYWGTKKRWSYHLICMRKHTYRFPWRSFLKIFKCLASSGIHTVFGWLDLLFKALHQERKRRKERIPTRLAWAPWVVVILPLFIDIWYEVFS